MCLDSRKPVFRVADQERACTDSEGWGGGTGGPYLLKNHKNIGFLSNTGPDPLKNHKATKPAFNVGPLLLCCAIIGPPAKRHFNNGVLLAADDDM